MVEHVSANTAEDPLAVGILPGALGCNFDRFDIEVVNPVPTYATVDGVLVPQQIARRRMPGKRFHNVLGRPWRRRVFRPMDMHDTPSFVG